MSITHRGHVLTQQQLDAIVPVLNNKMQGKIRGAKAFEAAVDKALEAAGCPVPAKPSAMLPIPVSAAEKVAKQYGYDQVVIIARRVGEEPDPHGEHVTTYGVNKAHCSVAARIGNFLKHKVMGWPEPPAEDVAPSFPSRVEPWLLECFGEEIANDRQERNHRFLEEALELVQSCGCTAGEAHQLVDYVFGRPVGEKRQEVGGVMVTLAALCLAQGLDMHQAGDDELARIWTMVEKIRAKQAAKPKHSPLPG